MGDPKIDIHITANDTESAEQVLNAVEDCIEEGDIDLKSVSVSAQEDPPAQKDEPPYLTSWL